MKSFPLVLPLSDQVKYWSSPLKCFLLLRHLKAHKMTKYKVRVFKFRLHMSEETTGQTQL